VEAWLRGLRASSVELRVPRRGDKRTLLATVEQNAAESFLQHRLRRSSDLTTRSQALQELQDALDLPDPPLRIECLDVSHLAGTGIVASLVVFEDGAARRSDYRRFAIKDQDGADDVRAVREVVGRRFRRYLHEQAEIAATAEVEGRRPKAFAYRPQLLVVDGGPAQAQAAQDELVGLGVNGVHVVGLAKRLEEVWPAGSPDPVILARGSEALYLLQRIRDEAHRVAIAYQRSLRKKAVATGALDDVRGLGPSRRAALMSRFGSVKGIGAATDDELLSVPGMGPVLVQSIRAALADSRRHAEAAPAVNVTTGEIMES
jgi:excinuclease ABC subunit C